MNPMMIFQLKKAWDTFQQNHPKFPLFLTAVSNEGIKEDTVISIDITTPEGKSYSSNLKVTSSDLELIETLKKMKP